MAINKNHEFEALNGVKCGIVEKNVPSQRIIFLKTLLEGNGFTVVVAPSPPPKTAVPVTPKDDEPILPPESLLPETYTVGVTDYTFNSINAIFGRLLRTSDGHVVTLAYWQQNETITNNEQPYFGRIV